MVHWLRFRGLQLFRLLRAAGWGILAVLAIITMPMWLNGFNAWSVTDIWTAAIISTVIIGILHLFRSDTTFLQQGHLPYWQYCLADYLGLCGLFSIIPLLAQNYLTAIAAFIGLIWVILPAGLLYRRQANRITGMFHWIPVDAYEWKTMLRSQWPIFILAIPLFLVCFFHPAFYIASMVLVAMVLGGGFEHLEPYSMRPTSLKEAISHWRKNAVLMYFWLIPSGLYLLIWHPYWWPLVLYVIATYEAWLAVLMFHKYNAWAPGRRRIYGGAVMTVGSMAILFPGGLIALIGMAIWMRTNMRDGV
ncbi:MAG: hypothetical protein RIR11_3683 [Bacteroidota bacterium]|jgi:hypothetical protein